MPRSELGEDIYAGAFDRELEQPDEYLTIEETPEGPAWHIGRMEQKARYRSLMREVPTFVEVDGPPREAITDLEVEQCYGVFAEEVQVGDMAILAKPGEKRPEAATMEELAEEITEYLSLEELIRKYRRY